MNRVNLPNKLVKAINVLILDNPFFATIVLQRDIIIDENCDTAWTDGPTIGFSPKFIEENDLDVLKFTLAHETLHITNCHHTRMNGKDGELWNKAADYAINWLLREYGFKLWPNCLIDNRFANKCAEDIYRILQNEPKSPNGSGNNNSGQNGNKSVQKVFGEVRPCPKGKETELEEEAKIQTKQAAQIAKQAGKLPAGMQKMFDNVPANVDWREALAQFVSIVSNNDYSFNKVNTRYSQTGFIFPGLYSKEIGNVIVACDTSGSVTAKEISIMMAELISILENLSEKQDIEVPTIYCDSEVNHFEILTSGDVPKPKGGGGTDFRPPFEYVAKNLETPACLVYITDGYCNSFPDNPGYPVLWALFVNNPTFKPPFGEVVYIAPGSY